MSNKLRKTSVLVSSLLFGASALSCISAMADNRVEGKLTDVSQSVFFQGASVKIKELNLATTTNRDGSFSFINIKPGSYTLEIQYIGTPKVIKTIVVADEKNHSANYVIGQEMESVIVYGQIAGAASALSRERASDNLKSIVSSDGIGQFPDQNAAEALQRLSGVSILRDQGEGRFVGVRGIDPNLNNVTINGLNVPSPESGVRSVALDVIPSELVESLEVSKTLTPDMDANALGGSIEVKSLSAFDRKGQSITLNAAVSHNELVGESSPKLSGSFSDRFTFDNGGELGIATAISWFKREFGSENIETDSGWSVMEFEDAASGDDVELYGAEEIEQRVYQITRERVGMALNLDYHHNSDNRFYLRTLYSDFSDNEFRMRNEYKFEKGKLDSVASSVTSGQFSEAEMDRDTKDREQVQEILSLIGGAEHDFEDWKLTYSIGYSKSNESEDDHIDADFAGEEINMAYVAGVKPTLSASANAYELSHFELDEIAFKDTLTEDEDLTVRFDVTHFEQWGELPVEVKFGGKYSRREKTNHVDEVIYDGGFDDLTAADFATAIPDYALGNFGGGLDRRAIRDFVNSQRANFDIDTIKTQESNLAEAYRNDEDILALYAMVSFDIDDWRVVTGLRYEDTSTSTRGNRVDVISDEVNDEERVESSVWYSSKDYSHFFPSVNVSYDFNDNLQARFSYTESLARPTFSQAAAYQLIETENTEDGTERKAQVGNPLLNPYESNNIDLSIAYYPDDVGVLSAGVFHKDISNFIIEQDIVDNGQWDCYEEVMSHVNGGDAKLSGVELAWTKSFDSGLLLGANATFIDADDNLPAQSDTLGNLTFGYQTQQLSARLTLAHKSESFVFNDSKLPVYEDAHNQIDFSLKYDISDKLQLSFNANNLTDEAYYLYHKSRAYNYQYESYGRSFELGISYKSF